MAKIILAKKLTPERKVEFQEFQEKKLPEMLMEDDKY